MEQLKKVLTIYLMIVVILVLVADIGIFYTASKVNKKTEKTLQNLGAGISLDVTKLSGHTSTTTPKYLTTSSASTTAELTMSVSNAKHIDLNIYFRASTTASVLNWTNYFSSDEGSNKNWYPEGSYTATSNILSTEGATELVHSWTPGATTTLAWVFKNKGIDPVASKYMRTRFWTSIANGDLYVEGISQSDVNN